MMNQLVVLLNLIGLLLFDTLFLADVRISQDVPATLEPGTEVRVTLEVEKGDLSGFAKLQLDLPPGLSASAIETKGASFTFADGKAKFIWMSLPSVPTFKLSYSLVVGPEARGPMEISGRLSFIENNERRSVEMPVSRFEVISNGTWAEDESDDPVVGEEVVSAAGAAPIPVPDPAPVPEQGDAAMALEEDALSTATVAMEEPQDADGVSAVRTITPVTEEEMLVEVVVRKGTLRGFGKLQETIPAGFTALEKESEDAIFTTQDRIVKFVWLNLPAKEELRVVYKLRGIGQPAGSYEVSGAFGYLMNDETRQSSAGSSTFRIGPGAMMNLEELANEDGSLNTMELEDVSLENGEEGTSADVRASNENDAPKTGTGRIPAPETGITYKVQITAAHREVGAEYFQERHRFTGDFGIERHEGWIKYVTGRFTEYRSARDQREAFVRAGHRFPGPFVTAYDQGRRITVQEALMISQQQWTP